jgi:hypothetical protein
MGYQGRSPINDVVRSVMSAAMLSPAMLVACGTTKNNPQPPTTDPTTATATTTETTPPTATATATATVTATTTTTAVATTTATATATTKPDVMVHPSTRPRGNGGNMPTRGFAGAVRARR